MATSKWLVVVLLLNSCTFVVYDEVTPEQTQKPRPEFGTRPPDCGHLYNVGRHSEWADCMGVGYK